ncbi:hypothetical protein [Sphingomonas parapaucimobilis]|uniref:hypothetical protein n=1 Tax=Sphingomonas parapaucimobilis TaxID=28213 RepID=UPI001427A161|nr:hypothetical protein [Sphingomonas parapaucimobilis]
MDKVTAYPEMKALIVFPAEGGSAGEICDGDQRKADQREEDGNEDVHVSAFPDMVSAATEDRAAVGAGRGWRGGADDGSERAGLEQHLGAGEVGEDRFRHAARPLRVATGVIPKMSFGVTAPFVAAQILRITAAEGIAPRRTRLTVDWSMPTRAAKAGSVIALADK